MKYYMCDICDKEVKEGEIAKIKHGQVIIDMCHGCYGLFAKCLRMLTVPPFRDEIDVLYTKFFKANK